MNWLKKIFGKWKHAIEEPDFENEDWGSEDEVQERDFNNKEFRQDYVKVVLKGLLRLPKRWKT